jgi:hypothetical protein
MFLRLKIKLKGCHFDITEVIEADSQAVLNTLTEQDVFENSRSYGNGAYVRKGTTSRVMVGPKLDFYLISSPSRKLWMTLCIHNYRYEFLKSYSS